MSRNKKSNAAKNKRERQMQQAVTKKPAMRAYCGRAYKPTGCRDMRPYSARRPAIIDEVKARWEQRETRQKLITASKPAPILSDTDWCAEPPAYFETGLMHGPRKPTFSQWNEMRRAAKVATFDAKPFGSVLSAAAQRQERIAGKVGIYSQGLAS